MVFRRMANQTRKVLAVFLMVGVSSIEAIPSRECMAAMTQAMNDDPESCPQPCGSLSLPSDGLTFLERLSESCRNLMQSYRNPGVSNGDLLYHKSPMKCPRPFILSPYQPNIIEAENSYGFAICTIPKSGCSHIRKLLQAMIHFPDPLPYDDRKQLYNAHNHLPTIWNYADLDGIPAGTYPSFSVGRNPYARLLSGFLDKMVHGASHGDAATQQAINRLLNTEGAWEGTTKGFHDFVRALQRHGVEKINPHFSPQHQACGRSGESFPFEYYLKIEDQAQWFPCMEHGLNLYPYTKTGWQRLEEDSVWVGGNPAFEGRIISDTQCWYRPPGFERCDQYYTATHPEWDGASLETLSGNALRAVPLPAHKVQLDSRIRDFHDTGAAGKTATWYTQEIGDIVYELYQTDFELFGYEREEFPTRLLFRPEN